MPPLALPSPVRAPGSPQRDHDRGGKHPPCPICGCKRGHCASGVPQHLKCKAAAKEFRFSNRPLQLAFAVNVASQFPDRSCNVTAYAVASAYGYNLPMRPTGHSLEYKKADELWGWFQGDKARSDGWVDVKGEEIVNCANAGQLTFGVIRASDLGPGHDNGHIFVVLGGNSLPHEDQSLPSLSIFDSVLNGATPTNRPLSKAVSAHAIPDIRFFCLLQD